jgi:hypothetical protein
VGILKKKMSYCPMRDESTRFSVCMLAPRCRMHQICSHFIGSYICVNEFSIKYICSRNIIVAGISLCIPAFISIMVCDQALVDAPDMVRCQMNFKRLSLTDIKIDIKRIPKKSTLIKAMEEAGIV